MPSGLDGLNLGGLGDVLGGLIYGFDEDLGTQVFLYEAKDIDDCNCINDFDIDAGDGPTGNLPVPFGEFTDLTEEIGPGFGSAWNKYTWSAKFFDGDGDEHPELYVGTFNVQLDLVGIFGTLMTAGAILVAGLQVGNFEVLETFFADQVEGDVDSPLGPFGALLNYDLPKTLQSQGGEIWKYDFVDKEWTQVVDPDTNDDIDEGDVGFREMTTFDGKLFAATSSGLIFNILDGSNNPTKILVSEEGEEWSALEGGPLDPEAGNTSIRTMQAVEVGEGEELLIVGTENTQTGGQIWTYDQEGNWTLVAVVPATTHSDTLIFGDDVYIGTWPYNIFKLDLETPFNPEEPDANLTDVTPDFSGEQPQTEFPDDLGVMKMIEFDGYFYVGSVNYFGGASLYRTQTPMDPESWEVIDTDGSLPLFGDHDTGTGTSGITLDLPDDGPEGNGEDPEPQLDQSLYYWDMAVADGRLFVGDFTFGTGQLFVSQNGTDFELAGNDFGGAYGVRELESVEFFEGLPTDGDQHNAVIVGTADPFYLPVPLEERVAEIDIFETGTNRRDRLEGGDKEDLLIGFREEDRINGGDDGDILMGDIPFLPAIGPLEDVDLSDLEGLTDLELLLGGLFGGMIGDGLTLEGGLQIDGPVGNNELGGLFGEGFGEGFGDLSPREFLYDLYGRRHNDVIHGEGGDDFIFGQDGRDRIYGGDGEDLIFGGLGNDVIDGGDDIDIIFGDLTPFGSDAFDTLLVGIGGLLGDEDIFEFLSLLTDLPDEFTMLFGEDSFYSRILEGRRSPFSDRIEAGEGNDLVFGGLGGDDILGQDGNDILMGGNGEDTVSGGMGNDFVWGDAGEDHVTGEEGNDFLFGGKDDDRVFGGEGNDIILGGAGDDDLRGGSGEDVYIFGTDFDYAEGEGPLFAFSPDITAGLQGGLEAPELPQGNEELPFEPFAEFGDDIIFDFESGVDKVIIGFSQFEGETADLDTNDNGRLDRGDDGFSRGFWGSLEFETDYGTITFFRQRSLDVDDIEFFVPEPV